MGWIVKKLNKFMEQIEDLYRKHCEASTEQPPPDMWNRIELSLNKKETKGTIVWLRFTSIAASLAILVALSVWIRFANISQKYDNYLSDMIDTQESEIDDAFLNNDNIINDTKTTSDDTYKKIPKQTIIAEIKSENTNKNLENRYDVFSTQTNSESDYSNNETVNDKEAITDNKYDNTNDIVDVINQVEQQNKYANALFINPHPETSGNKKKAQVEIGGAYSPIYSYRQVSDRNNDNLLTSDYPNESGIVNNGGGISLNVKIGERWSVESGVKYAKMGHKINNPEINNHHFAKEQNVYILNHIILNNTMGEVTVGQSFLNDATIPIDIPTPPNVIPIVEEYPLIRSIEQNLDYLEVPFTFRYNITDARFTISLSAGLSANFLVNNSFYLKHNNIKEKIGETEGISNLTMSTHAGVSFATPVFKQLSLHIEPRLNYFLDEINKNHVYKYRPYSLGIYSGVRYKFGN